MGLRFVALLLILIPLLTACPSQNADEIQPSMTILGNAERTTQQNSIILEGQLQDNQNIAAFSYRLNGGEEQSVLDSLGKSLYRFSITGLQDGQNTIELSASDASGNKASQDIIVYYQQGLSGLWSQEASYTACDDNYQAKLNLNLDFNETQVSGTVSLELDHSWSGSFVGFQNDQVLHGSMSLTDSLGQVQTGQLLLKHKGETLLGQVIFKGAIPCSSHRVDDLEISLELTR